MTKKKIGISICVVFILLLAVGFGFAHDFVMSTAQKHIYYRKYESAVSRYSAEFGVSEALVYAVIKTESNFDPSARSRVGASGLMQLTPETFIDVAERLAGDDPSGLDINDPETNIRYGILYLSWLFEIFESEKAVIAAYNAGPGRVLQWVKDDPELSSIPIGETRIYVAKVQKAKAAYTRLYYS